MYALFLWIHAVFSATFFFFDRMFESVLFGLLGIVFFFAFAPFDFSRKHSKNPEPSLHNTEKWVSEARRNVVIFLQDGTYYLALAFFYASLYGVAYGLSDTLGFVATRLYGIVTLTLAIASFVAFFTFWKKSPTVSRLFRSNSLVFSFVHFFLLLFRLFSWGVLDDGIFFWNVGISLISLISVALFDLSADMGRRKFAYGFFLLYAYVSILTFISVVFSTDFFKTTVFLALASTFIIFEGAAKIPILRPFRMLSAYIAVGFSYFCVLSAFVYAFSRGTDYFIYGIFFVIAAFQYFLHKTYDNPGSYLSVLAIIWYGYFDLFFPAKGTGFFPFLLFTFTLPTIGLFATKIRNSFRRYDRHLLISIALLHASGFFLSYFFRFPETSILEISLLSLMFSALLFGSYLSLRRS